MRLFARKIQACGNTMIDEIRLRQLYLDEQLSIRAIAARERVSTRMVYDALKRYGIPRRANGYHQPATPPLLDADTLRRLYLDEHYSIRGIAAHCQVSTRAVLDALTHHGIPRRTPWQRRTPPPAILTVGQDVIDEARLRHVYVQEGQSINAIAAMYQCAPSRIRTALVRWGIERRPRGRPPPHTTR
jgi:predicted DNA-binding protein YlxM (UPF0122 family)